MSYGILITHCSKFEEGITPSHTLNIKNWKLRICASSKLPTKKQVHCLSRTGAESRRMASRESWTSKDWTMD